MEQNLNLFIALWMAGGYLLYNLITVTSFGWLPSVSESQWEFEERGYNWPFTAFTFLVFAIPLVILASHNLNNTIYAALFTLSSMAFGFTGAATTFDKGIGRKVHFISSLIGLLAAVLGVGVVFGHWYAGPIIIVAGLITYKYNKKFTVLVVEHVAVLSILPGFII